MFRFFYQRLQKNTTGKCAGIGKRPSRQKALAPERPWRQKGPGVKKPWASQKKPKKIDR
jgi:hypothetical protein